MFSLMRFYCNYKYLQWVFSFVTNFKYSNIGIYNFINRLNFVLRIFQNRIHLQKWKDLHKFCKCIKPLVIAYLVYIVRNDEQYSENKKHHAFIFFITFFSMCLLLSFPIKIKRFLLTLNPFIGSYNHVSTTLHLDVAAFTTTIRKNIYIF